jgi:DNA-binding MarR family transcriptional regulator
MPSTKVKVRANPAAGPQDNAVRALIRTFGLLERVMHPYFARHGISGAQWGVLRNLHRAEQEGSPGLRLTDLSDRLLLRPPSVTGVVDRLQRAGLVVRGGSPTDLRAKQIGLTAEGRRLVERILSGHSDQLETVLAGLSPDERVELQRLLAQWGKHLEGLLERGIAASIG